MKKLKSNMDLVKDLMNYSPYGALGQAFVVMAIRKYADEIVENPIPHDPDSMFNGAAWNAIAADVQKRCNEFYNPKK